ncbi:UPF0182 family protein [Nocardioides sp. dk4132]|uniref:UPF0182 family membrane protein n=1 Tax=unclassified Nocardioides TaxID=2615069 RepID=UPI00129609C2|nr:MULTISPECIES: UPF0182 family protein [unclassified Nocardioides]MQW75581.1 UPF0182 family protein [Nocardioides sp. dk4132]QGA08487.1 UPF0182 family protein [Nocardioides sp. dk884]
MSDLFGSDDPRAAKQPPQRSGRSRALVVTGVVLVVAFFGLTTFAGIYTDRLWYRDGGYGGVFSRLFWTRAVLFVVFGLVMALVVGLNMHLAYRFRPLFHPRSSEQAGLDRYRDAVAPIRTWLLVGVSLVVGLFAGTSALGEWRNYLLWRNGKDFGSDDAQFGKDIGFYVFDLPFWHFLVDYAMALTMIALIAAALVHYLYGGIRLQSPGDRLSGAAQVQLSLLLGLFVLAKAVDYWLDRFDLVHQGSGLITGMTYTDENAVLPAKNILMGIAVICAVLFFLNVWRRTWTLPSVGIALLALSAILLGVIWPGIVQQFQVKPSEADKEATYIARNIEATRAAFDLDEVEEVGYASTTTTGDADLDKARAVRSQAASVPLVDPKLVRQTFEQNQQGRVYYSVADVLDVDRYRIGGRDRALVLGARELDQSGLNEGDRNWSNLHTVYTHGNGIIAAYANQRGADDSSEGTDIQWAEGNQTNDDGSRQDALSKAVGGYESRIYFGEQSPSYSVVGKEDDESPSVELGLAGATEDEEQTTTYDGDGGVPIGSTFRQLLYAIKFGEPNFLLSGRVHGGSEILYNRTPRERVEKVAPWLTIDDDSYPAIVDGKIVWIVDGYTTTDRYPFSERESFEDMTDDSLQEQTGLQTLPTDEINYMRNAVKATVDAYDGTVTLYAWDEEDPILQTWRSAFPDTVKDRSEISDELMEHLRYPEDLFKVQRYHYARYHVTDAGDWYQGNDRWAVPRDPNSTNDLQPPYRLFNEGADAGEGANGEQDWSLTSVFVPYGKENLASFVTVNSDATSDDYGKMTVLQLQDQNTKGPGLIANEFENDEAVRDALLPYNQGQSKPTYGNLLTVPVADGLMYIQPVYAVRSASSGGYPILRFVLVSYGDSVGVGETLTTAIADALDVELGPGGGPGAGAGAGNNGGGNNGGGNGGQGPDNGPALSVDQRIGRLLGQADEAFAEADRALAAGDLAGYQESVERAQELVSSAIRLAEQRDDREDTAQPDGSAETPGDTETEEGAGS